MRSLLCIGLGLGVLLSAEPVSAQLPVKSDFATVAPYSASAERRVPAALPYGLRFHAQHDFYPRFRYRGRYYPGSIQVYQPRRYYHPQFGYRYWYRY